MRRRGGAPDRLLATVLFTDIVGSTSRAAELGDRRWRQLVARHHALVRSSLRRHRGRELDTAGDGFFAAFDHPGMAIACATELTTRVRSLQLEIRAGINTGEVETMGPKVGGIAVHVGSRVMSKAGPGEVWVSGTVRDLMAGSEVRFEDRGVHELKGVPGEWHLYSVQAPPSVEPSAEEAAEAPSERESWVVTHRRPAALIALGVVVGLIAASIVLFRGGDDGQAVALRGSAAVSFDVATNQPVDVVPIGEPTAIAIGADTVWVISQNNTLGAIDPTTGTLTPIGLPGPPTGLAADAASAWVTAGFGTTESGESAVLRYSMTTLLREQLIPSDDGVRGIAIGEGGAWVTNSITNTVTKIDLETGAPVDEARVGEQPEAIVVGSGSVWVANVVARTLSRIDPRTLDQAEITLSDAPTAIAVGFDKVWVTSTTGNSLTVIDATSNSRVKTLPLEQGPTGVAVGTDAVWVALSGGAIVRVDPTEIRIVATLPLPGPAQGVAVAGDRVWVAVQE
jgi:YVTN family beta-propeller protein